MKINLTYKHIVSALIISVLCAFVPSIHNTDTVPSPSLSAGEGTPAAEAVETPQISASTEYSTPIIYYSQSDPAWGSYLYGGGDPLSSYGCGPTVLAMLVSSLTDTALTPPQAADFAAANGYWSSGYGSRHGLIPEGAASYGLNVTVLNSKTSEGLKYALTYNKLVVFLVGPGEFTSTGHFIIAYGVNADGTIKIADPANPGNLDRSFNAESLFAQVSDASDAAGPIWVISR